MTFDEMKARMEEARKKAAENRQSTTKSRPAR